MLIESLKKLKVIQEQIDKIIDSISGRITESIDHDREKIKYFI